MSNAIEKKQFPLINAAYSNLCEKTAAGEVSPEVMQKINLLVASLSARNFVGANAVQTVSAFYINFLSFLGFFSFFKHLCITYFQLNLFNYLFKTQDLANTAWNQHKEWIKGVKILIQLASKK